MRNENVDFKRSSLGESIKSRIEIGINGNFETDNSIDI